MKLLIASDLHGSAHYTRLLFERAKVESPDKVILLGDIYYHGPRNPFPKEYAPMLVAEILNSHKENLLVIKGNCDSEVDQMISEFDFVEDYYVVKLAKRRLICVHGHKLQQEFLPPINEGDILAYGHLHTGFIQHIEGVIHINPGSVALPKDNNHSYIVLDDIGIYLKDIKGNILQNFKFIN